MDGRDIIIVGSRCLLPFGTDKKRIERHYNAVLRPFLATLCRFPKVHAVLHYSGVVFHWIERTAPEFFTLLEEMLARRQIEILSGGFYEPAFPLFPADSVAQIEFFTAYLRKAFGKRPAGCYMEAPSWEQSLVSPLQTCGISYVFLDDTAFPSSLSAPEQPIAGPFLTEHRGKTLAVFPINTQFSKNCRENGVLAAWEDFAHSRAVSRAENEARVWTLFPERMDVEAGDDGSGETTVTTAALEQFFALLTEQNARNDGETLTMLPNRVYKQAFASDAANVKNIFFPHAFDKQFLLDCPEAYNIYANIVYSQVFVYQIRGDKARKTSAKNELWKAESAALFHSGENGGMPAVVKPSLRHAAYNAIIQTENIARRGYTASLVAFDFDFDGVNEYLYQGKFYNCCVKTRRASVFELDVLPAAWNYGATYCESVHSHDEHTTACESFVDSLVMIHDDTIQCETIQNNTIQQNTLQRDTLQGDGLPLYYTLGEFDRGAGKVSFTSTAHNLSCEKTFRFKKETVTVSYLLTNNHTEKITVRLDTIFNLAFSGEGEQNLRIIRENPDGAIKTLEFQDLHNENILNFTAKAHFYASIEHIHTAGFYQHTRCVIGREVSLKAGEKTELRLVVRIT